MWQPFLYIHLQVVAHLVGFFHAGVLWHYQVKFHVAMVSGFASPQVMKAN
jgi:hypothetical protein